MPKEVNKVLVYGCDYCDFETGDIEEVKGHELTCEQNPAMRACGTCARPVSGGDKCPLPNPYHRKHALCYAWLDPNPVKAKAPKKRGK
jgi:hypothetical protein